MFELALRLAGKGPAAARTRARMLLAHVGLTDARDLFPNQLSGGMRKRVALARSLAYDPAIFLMDESFSALYAQTGFRLGNFFLNLLGQSGQTVVFVTHDIEEAVTLADRVLVISRGPGRIETEIAVRPAAAARLPCQPLRPRFHGVAAACLGCARLQPCPGPCLHQRFGIGLALTGAVVGELVGASAGLGWYITNSLNIIDMTGAVTALLVMASCCDADDLRRPARGEAPSCLAKRGRGAR